MVAAYRPGPMQFIPDYIARMHGEAEVEYRHPAMKPIFESTFGIPLYQEQLMRAAVELAGYTPSESDELRKAISKKKKEDIEKHRAKFVKGAVEKGMVKDIAEAIYADWEEFARYGFNKSHAADYGVIAVQTAYLKTHFTAEYMTALLSASASQTEKVAFYVADSRAMGVPVLPPDINSSGWDFEIEDPYSSSTMSTDAQGENNKPSIRFGLGAIKNVGQGAVELIVEARKEGKFSDLNDFARRVNLQKVGKRSLEFLIKVGAMDALGNRAALLASLDRIVAISSNHFRAAEAGQMSLFGTTTGVIEEITLPDVKNVDRREMLNWERELIGLYISDHPLTPIQPQLAQIVTYFSGQLGEAQHEEKVRVAGLVTSVRPYQTKAGKPMGFVTLEDIQGNMDLVLFPRTWKDYQAVLNVGNIVIIEGKVDAQSTPPKILVDAVRTELKMLVSVDQPAPTTAPVSKAMPRPEVKPVIKPTPMTPARQVAEAPATYAARPAPADDWTDNSMPPPPDNFPDDWQPSFEEEIIASRPEPFDELRTAPKVDNKPVAPRDLTEKAKAESEVEEREPVEASTEPSRSVQSEAVGQDSILSHIEQPHPIIPPSLYVPLAKEEKDQEHPPKQITVMLRSTGDHERDKRRIKTIYGTLISFHGRDKFSFQIFENGKGYLMDFPGESTRVCPEMLARLQKLMGEESWRVEEITFQ